MHAPQWVLDEIERVNPLARLGWAGEDRESKDEPLNKGMFAVLDLYPKRLADRTFKTLWGDRGPVFGSYYDPLERIPVWISNIAPEDVFSGAVIGIIKRYCEDIQERLDRTWREEQEQQRKMKKELAGEVGSYMYWQSKRESNATNTLPQKFVTQEEKARAAGDFEKHEEPAPPVHGVALT
jgi:hypothetical protein